MTNSAQLLIGNEIVFPWDNYDFSLNLDNFPGSKLARTQSNMYPVVGSPLRHQWTETIEEEAGSNEGTIKDEANDKENKTRFLNPGQDIKNGFHRIKSMSVKRRTHSSFPYNNSSHGTNPGNIEQDNITVKRASVNKVSRVQHISPLMSPSLIESVMASLPDRRISNSLNTNMKKKLSGMFPRHSVAKSETGSVKSVDSTETWKVSQKSIKQDVIVPITGEPEVNESSSRSNSRSGSPASELSSFSRLETPSLSPLPFSFPSPPATLPSFTTSPSPNSIMLKENPYCSNLSESSCHSSAVYTPSSTYQSISVPKNADQLTFFEQVPSVPPSTRSAYSQQFDTTSFQVSIYSQNTVNKKKTKKRNPFSRLKKWFFSK